VSLDNRGPHKGSVLPRHWCLASHCFQLCLTQVGQNLLLSLLQCEQNRRGHQPVLMETMHLTGRQQHALQIFDGCLGSLELLIISNHATITPTIPRRVKSFPV
jgi:hypothetical protein